MRSIVQRLLVTVYSLQHYVYHYLGLWVKKKPQSRHVPLAFYRHFPRVSEHLLL